MPIIKNYGFLWERKHFFRGVGRDKGHLRGWAKGNKDQLVDFKEQIGVYVLYDTNQNIVYVGQAGNQTRGIRPQPAIYFPTSAKSACCAG